MMSSSSSPVPSKAEPRITVTVSGERREVFMSFGMLNELAALAGGPEGVPRLSFDPGASMAALELMLAPRDKRGKILEVGEDEVIVPGDMDPETAEQLLDWAGAHVMDFFIRRFAKNVRLLGSQAGPLAEVGSSLTSSGTSAGKTA